MKKETAVSQNLLNKKKKIIQLKNKSKNLKKKSKKKKLNFFTQVTQKLLKPLEKTK